MQTGKIKQSNVPQPRWVYTAAPEDEVAALAAACNVDLPVAQVLWNRGYTSVEQAQQFLQPATYTFSAPGLMKGVGAAVARLLLAIRAGERIVVYGDYDVDGQVSVAVLVSVLRRLGANASYYVPQRLTEGYGLSRDGVAHVAEQAELIVTVDCGITSVDEVAYARELGVDCIITDHHEPGSSLPAAVAILNPKQPDCSYPEKQLAGCGVVYTLVRALYEATGASQDAAEEWLDLVALGTVADVVPLQGENRALVAKGLPRLGQRIGLRALCAVADVDVETVTAGQIGFRLGPRLNAAGRLDDAGLGVRLLLTDDGTEASTIAAALNEQNEQRQRIEQRILDAGHEHVTEHARMGEERALVVVGEQWHPGVIGIVASRLVETYGLPALVISIDEDEAVGSGRSIPGFDLHDALTDVQSYFTRFGGHRAAAGFSLPASAVPAFRADFIELANRRLAPADLQPTVHVDAVLAGHDANVQMAEQFGRLAPFGFGNAEPVVVLTGQQLVESRAVGRDQAHWRLVLAEPGQRSGTNGIGFGMAPAYAARYGEGTVVDVAGGLSLNHWQGQTEAQLRLRDVTVHRGEMQAVMETLQRIGTKKQAADDDNAVDSATWDQQPAAEDKKQRWRVFDARQAAGSEADVGAVRDLMVRRAWSHADVVLVWMHGEAGITGGVRKRDVDGEESRSFVCCGPLPHTAAPVETGALVMWSVPRSTEAWQQLLAAGVTWADRLDVYAAITPSLLQEARLQAEADLPSIDTLRHLYTALQRALVKGGATIQYMAFAHTVSASGTVLSSAGVRYGLSVFSEAGLVHWTEQSPERGLVQFPNVPAGKVDLTQVVRYNEGERQRHDILAYFDHIQHASLGDIIAPSAHRAVTST